MAEDAVPKLKAETITAYLKVGIFSKSTGKSGAACRCERRHKRVPLMVAILSSAMLIRV